MAKEYVPQTIEEYYRENPQGAYSGPASSQQFPEPQGYYVTPGVAYMTTAAFALAVVIILYLLMGSHRVKSLYAQVGPMLRWVRPTLLWGVSGLLYLVAAWQLIGLISGVAEIAPLGNDWTFDTTAFFVVKFALLLLCIFLAKWLKSVLKNGRVVTPPES